MLLEDEQVVWDETVQAETGIGTFEVLSTDTTPPPPKVERQKPVGTEEWASWFDEYRPTPKSNPATAMLGNNYVGLGGGVGNTSNLASSMIHISYEESEEPLMTGVGKIMNPRRDIQRRIFVGVS
jgi:hypothetical protein